VAFNPKQMYTCASLHILRYTVRAVQTVTQSLERLETLIMHNSYFSHIKQQIYGKKVFKLLLRREKESSS